MAGHGIKIDVSPEVTRLIASKRVTGSTLRELEKEFGFSRPVINRILSSDLGKAVAKGLMEDAVAIAAVTVKRKIADMTDLAVSALEYHLKEKSLDAVKTYLKVMGVEAAEKQELQQQSITVVLPGQQAPKDIDVN